MGKGDTNARHDAARQSPPSASIPGAQSIGKEEAKSLDDRIAAKQRQGHLSPTRNGASSSILPQGNASLRADVKKAPVSAIDGSLSKTNPSIRRGESESPEQNRPSSRGRLKNTGTENYSDVSGNGSDPSIKFPDSDAESSGVSSGVWNKKMGAKTEAIVKDEKKNTQQDNRNGQSLGVSHGSLSSNNSDALSSLDARIDAKIRGSRLPTVAKQVEQSPIANPDNGEDLYNKQGQCKSTSSSDDEVDQIGEKGKALVSAPPKVTTANGLGNAPDLEYGVSEAKDHGYEEGLAVAIAVQDEEDLFIPGATQYDPDAKPPLYKNNRVRRYACIACILIVVIAVGVAVGVSSAGDKVPAPTLAPTTFRDTLGIQAQIAVVVGEEALGDPFSPQSLALEWIINEDPAMLAPEAINLIQRYILSFFYISTTQLRPWLSCNPPVDNENSTCIFNKLVETYPNETYDTFEQIRWLSVEHECAWTGVTCDSDNRTVAIELTGQQIRGELPGEIAQLSYLQSITFNWNEFYGTLPSELAELSTLLNIELHYNFFSGSIPLEWFNSSQDLQTLNLAGNMLTGQLPTEIGLLRSLDGLLLFENMINGTIPTEISGMSNLAFARWGSNFMTGPLPTELGTLTGLQELWILRNLYTGGIPSEFGNLENLNDLRISYNGFSGPIPEEFYNMARLRRFDALDCNLTGTISTQIGTLSNLEVFRVRNNQLTGTIPTEIGALATLAALWIHLNEITGTMPDQICELRGSKGLQYLDADCRSDDPTTDPLVSCIEGCCTDCCDSFSGICLESS